MSKTKKTFRVVARVTMETDMEIACNTLEEAVAEARKLEVLDFVKPLGDHLDSNLEITGIWT